MISDFAAVPNYLLTYNLTEVFHGLLNTTQ